MNQQNFRCPIFGILERINGFRKGGLNVTIDLFHSCFLLHPIILAFVLELTEFSMLNFGNLMRINVVKKGGLTVTHNKLSI